MGQPPDIERYCHRRILAGVEGEPRRLPVNGKNLRAIRISRLQLRLSLLLPVCEDSQVRMAEALCMKSWY